MEVNNISIAFKSPAEIIDIVQSNPDGVVSFKLVPKNELLIASTSTQQNNHQTNKKTRKYIRAHFDYNGDEDPLQPCKQAALSFQNGDVLEVLADDDPYWLQARCVGHGTLITAPLDQGDHNSLLYMRLFR